MISYDGFFNLFISLSPNQFFEKKRNEYYGTNFY